MSKPDLDAIQARHSETTNLGEWETTRSNDVVVYAPRGFGAYHLIAHADSKQDAEFIAHARNDVPALLAYARDLEARLGRVEAVAEKWRYKGEFGWGAWQEGHGPDPEGYALDQASSEIRAALTAREAAG